MGDNSDRNRQLDHIIAAARGTYDNPARTRQSVLACVGALKAAAANVAKRADDGKLAGAGEDIGCAVEGLVQTIENYETLLRWAAGIIRATRFLPPESALKPGLLDPLTTLRWDAQPGGLYELWFALMDAAGIGMDAYDSRALKRLANTARGKRMREPLATRKEAADAALWELIRPYRHLGDARLIEAELGKKVDVYLNGYDPDGKDVTKKVYNFRRRANTLLAIKGDRKKRSYKKRGPRAKSRARNLRVQ